MKKTILKLTAALLCAAPVLTSCGNDDDDPNADKRIFQQYEVRVSGQTAMAYANMRRAAADGKRVRLSGDARLYAGTREMNYTMEVSETEPEFNYWSAVDNGATEVTFRLVGGSGNVLTNTLPLNLIPDYKITVPDGVITPSTRLTIDASLLNVGNVSVEIVDPMTVGDAGRYPASVTAAGNVLFSKLPPEGTYTLTTSSSVMLPTQQNDGKAGGSMRLVKINSQTVKVMK